jgi:hypothetical protein
MPGKVRPPGVAPRERIRLFAMVALAAVVVYVIVNGLMSLGARRGGPGVDAVRDPAEMLPPPAVDRSVLESSLASPGDRASVGRLLGAVEVFRNATGIGFRSPSVEDVLQRAEAWRGERVVVRGRIEGEPIRTERPGAAGAEVHEFVVRDVAGGTWKILAGEAPPSEAGGVVKVLGLVLRLDAQGPDEVGGDPDGPDRRPVVVAGRVVPSVLPERFEHFDLRWLELVQEASDEQREDLRTPAVWYSLAWARTVGPEGFARAAASGEVGIRDMPAYAEITAEHDTLQGRAFRVRGRLVEIHPDLDLPENPAGLESVYRLLVEHGSGTRRQRTVLLAPFEAFAQRPRRDDEIVAEGIYLKIWTTTDESGRLIHLPLLISPRVRTAAAVESEDR